MPCTSSESRQHCQIIGKKNAGESLEGRGAFVTTSALSGFDDSRDVNQPPIDRKRVGLLDDSK